MSSAVTTDRRQAVYQAYLGFQSLVRGGRVTPGWICGGPSFWYAEGGPQERMLWVVDPVTNSREPLCDVDRLRKALTEALGCEPAGQGFPFTPLHFTTERSLLFSLEGDTWILELNSYEVTRQPTPNTFAMYTLLANEVQRSSPQTFEQEAFMALGKMIVPEAVSPDGQWFASSCAHNIVIRASVDGQSMPLTTDGTEEHFWDVETLKWQSWSPDSQRLAVFKIDTSGMARIPTIHWLKRLPRAAEVTTIPAGGVLNRNELFVVDIHGGRPVQVELGDTTDQYLVLLGWRADGQELLVARYDRLFSQVEILAADPRTGTTRTVLAERSNTWLTNQHAALWSTDTGFWMLPDGSGFLWRSERDGWAHLYHYDLQGALITRLTQGEYPVIGVTHVDVAGGWVYFQAHGEEDRPYDNHLYRVPLAGGDAQRLTDGAGRHEISFAPSHDCFVDTYSSVDCPPRSELRSANGCQLRILGEADISALKQVGYVPSKEYVVKAADGETDLWVTLHFPHDFEPTKKYPLVEEIYAGPQMTKRAMDFGVLPDMYAPFAPTMNHARALAQHGFIVMTMDGRGTPGRSKAFHDAIYRNWGNFEIADHAGAIRQLAARESFIDLERVGITGLSWGGHYTFRALVQAPDIYKVGIAEVPGFDSRAFTLYEVYLGMPADNKDLYETADVLPLAPELKGQLLLTGGTNDTGTQVDFYRMSEALIRAGIQHDTMAYPNCGHGFPGASGRYNAELKTNWFIRHLKP